MPRFSHLVWVRTKFKLSIEFDGAGTFSEGGAVVEVAWMRTHATTIQQPQKIMVLVSAFQMASAIAPKTPLTRLACAAEHA